MIKGRWALEGKHTLPLIFFFLWVLVGFWSVVPLAAISPLVPVVIGSFTPGIAATGIALMSRRRDSMQDLFGRLARWRVRPVWYLVAVGLPVGIAVLSVLFASLAGVPDAAEVGVISFDTTVFIFALAVGEEVGWRGFALPRLMASQPALSASLILGAVHALWHWPLIIVPGQLLSDVPLLAHTLVILAASVLYTWILQHTGGSVFMAVLFHGALNAVSPFYGGVGPVAGSWLQAGGFCLAAMVVVLRYGIHLRRA